MTNETSEPAVPVRELRTLLEVWQRRHGEATRVLSDFRLRPPAPEIRAWREAEQAASATIITQLVTLLDRYDTADQEPA